MDDWPLDGSGANRGVVVTGRAVSSPTVLLVDEWARVTDAILTAELHRCNALVSRLRLGERNDIAQLLAPFLDSTTSS